MHTYISISLKQYWLDSPCDISRQLSQRREIFWYTLLFLYLWYEKKSNVMWFSNLFRILVHFFPSYHWFVSNFLLLALRHPIPPFLGKKLPTLIFSQLAKPATLLNSSSKFFSHFFVFFLFLDSIDTVLFKHDEVDQTYTWLAQKTWNGIYRKVTWDLVV